MAFSDSLHGMIWISVAIAGVAMEARGISPVYLKGYGIRMRAGRPRSRVMACGGGLRNMISIPGTYRLCFNQGTGDITGVPHLLRE